MTYRIEINKRAGKFIKAQPPKQQARILNAIYQLPKGDVKALTNYENTYRLRVGDYRIIYVIDHDILLITVINAGNRGQIYNRL